MTLSDLIKIITRYLEGIHCTGILMILTPKRRKILIRLHNDEAAYYQNWQPMKNFSKGSTVSESRLLENTRPNIKECFYAGISKKTSNRFRKSMTCPPFSSCQPLLVGHSECEEGSGNFCLYHGTYRYQK